MHDELDQRLIELETKVAYQDDELLKMQDTVRSQQQQMYQLEKRMDWVLSRCKDLLESQDKSPIANEKPPHY